MPYRKKYGRKRVKTSRRYRKTSSKKGVARIAKAVFNRSVETKEARYAYTAVGTTAANFSSIGYGSTAIVAGCFGGISNGTGQNNRIGSAIYARGIRIYFAIQPGDSNNNLRIIVVSPKSGAPIFPSSVSSFLQSLLSNGASGATQWTYPVDTQRYRVHLDKMYNLRFNPIDGSTGTSVPQTKFLKTFIKINRKMFWDDTSTMNNDVYIVALSDSGVNPNPGVIGGFVNCYFKDA